MFELPSARTFIAGGNEFLFARFYDVYEGVQLVQLNSPISVPDNTPSDSQNVEETRNLIKHPTGRNAHIFLQRIFHLHFQRKSAYVLLIMLLITSTARKRGCTLNVQPLNKPILFSSGLKFFYVCLYLRLGKRIYK